MYEARLNGCHPVAPLLGTTLAFIRSQAGSYVLCEARERVNDRQLAVLRYRSTVQQEIGPLSPFQSGRGLTIVFELYLEGVMRLDCLAFLAAQKSRIRQP